MSAEDKRVLPTPNIIRAPPIIGLPARGTPNSNVVRAINALFQYQDINLWLSTVRNITCASSRWEDVSSYLSAWTIEESYFKHPEYLDNKAIYAVFIKNIQDADLKERLQLEGVSSKYITGAQVSMFATCSSLVPDLCSASGITTPCGRQQAKS